MRRIAYASVAVVGLMPVALHAQWPFQSSAKPETPAAAAPAQVPPAAQVGPPTATPAPHASTGMPATTPTPYGAAPTGPVPTGPMPIAPAGSYSPPQPAVCPPSNSGCACCPSTSRPSSPPSYMNYTGPSAYPGYGQPTTVPVSGYPSGPGYGQPGAVTTAGGYVPQGYTTPEGEAVAVARNIPGVPPSVQHATYQSHFDRLPVAPPVDMSANALPEKQSWWRRVVLRQKTVTAPGEEIKGNFSPTPPTNVAYDEKPIISEVPTKEATSNPSLGKRMFGWLPFVD